MALPLIVILAAISAMRPAHAQDSGAALLHAASWYAGAGGFDVHAKVALVSFGTGGAATVQFSIESGGYFYPVTAKGTSGGKSLQSIKPLELTWEWPAGAGPVPVAAGMAVEIRVSASDEILRVMYCVDYLGARRRMNDERWEFVVIPAGEKVSYAIVPRAFYDTTEVRWTKRYGIIFGSFEDSGYGAAETEEVETPAMCKLGWPIANQPGTRILPGRDGWERGKSLGSATYL